jgi:hypothetical protein
MLAATWPALPITELVTCLTLSAVLLLVGLTSLVLEQRRWRRVATRGDGQERRHNRYRMIRRSVLSLVLALSGPTLAIGWLFLDPVEHRTGFVYFWTAVLVFVLGMVVCAVVDAFLVWRFALVQASRLSEVEIQQWQDLRASLRRRRKTTASVGEPLQPHELN